mmetsp:Transcript_10585/g.22751  ORF Transcript_10585/g.22751 Transcript_10585/m.22751 type:complete len:84 (+) Transcript_10585:792-1043(+)
MSHSMLMTDTRTLSLLGGGVCPSLHASSPLNAITPATTSCLSHTGQQHFRVTWALLLSPPAEHPPFLQNPGTTPPGVAPYNQQ